MKPRLFIRADAGVSIGYGHVMRCLALAQEWLAQGGRAVFISHDLSAALQQRLDASGCGWRNIPHAHPHPDDLHTTLATLQEMASLGGWVVLDGYHFAPDYQAAVRAAGYRVLVLDDMAHWPAYHADLLLNQNPRSEFLAYNCDAKLLLGTNYVLLRQEFRVWREWQREYPPMARKLLITLGGSDPQNVTLKVLQALRRAPVAGLEMTVLAGGNNPHLAQLTQAVAETEGYGAVKVLQDARDMPALLARADVAIAASGSTTWEMAFMQLPALLIVVADNQRDVARGAEEAGAAVSLGWWQDVTAEEIAGQLNRLARDVAMRQRMGVCGRRLIDGQGARRVVAGLEFKL